MPTTRDGDLIVLPPETLAQICRHYRRLGLSSLLIHAPPDARRQVLVRVVRGAISRSVVEDDGERWVVAPRFPRGRLRLPLVRRSRTTYIVRRPRPTPHWKVVHGRSRGGKRRGGREPKGFRPRREFELEAAAPPVVDWTGPLSLQLAARIPPRRGVYVVVRDGAPHYVGLSTNLPMRIGSHMRQIHRWCGGRKPLARFGVHLGTVIPSSDAILRQVEATLIASLRGLTNVVRPKSRTQMRNIGARPSFLPYTQYLLELSLRELGELAGWSEEELADPGALWRG